MKYPSQMPVIGIIRGADSSVVEGAIAAALTGGLLVMEITLSHPDAIKQLTSAKARFGDDIELGAGTVMDADSANKAIDAGAEFIVSPAVVMEVIDVCLNRKVPVFPGALTPTEVLAAHRAGATMVKIFPVSAMGAGYLKSLKGPFPDIKLLPTGGITADAAAEYFKAGATAIGVGGELFKKDWLARKDWRSIENMAKAYVDAVKGPV